MSWTVQNHDLFDAEFEMLALDVQDKLLVMALLLKEEGPDLGRPYVDTLKPSEFANMKELRFSVGKSCWRVAFAFDEQRKAILLIAGNKTGANQKKFYKELIKTAEQRMTQHLANVPKEDRKDGKKHR